MRPRRRIRVGMEQKLLNIQYDYHYETIDADGAKAMLAEQAGLAGRHSDMDACLLLEPIRLIFDRNNRLLEGTDALAHIAGTDCPGGGRLPRASGLGGKGARVEGKPHAEEEER